MVVLADADSIAAVPASRWPALTMHSEVIVLLLGDPLERDPPRAPLPFATPMNRVELDTGVAFPRPRWIPELVAPVAAALTKTGRESGWERSSMYGERSGVA